MIGSRGSLRKLYVQKLNDPSFIFFILLDKLSIPDDSFESASPDVIFVTVVHVR